MSLLGKDRQGSHTTHARRAQGGTPRGPGAACFGASTPAAPRNLEHSRNGGLTPRLGSPIGRRTGAEMTQDTAISTCSGLHPLPSRASSQKMLISSQQATRCVRSFPLPLLSFPISLSFGYFLG